MTTRPPPYPSNFAGQDEAADASNFANALRPPPRGLHALHQFCPAVTSHSGCLDVLLFRNVLLVVYAAADEVVIARGTDLQAMRRLTCPSASDDYVTAVAFRERDAAVAAAFGNTIVVFEGWSDAAKERAYVYDSDCTEVTLDASQTPITDTIVSLSWSADGNTICAVADAIAIWVLDPTYLPIKYQLYCTIPPSKIPTHPLALASISPCACYVAVSGLYARIAYIFSLNPSTNSPAAEIVHGRSGISALDWKRRGGGNPALMSVDRDGTLRLWVRASVISPGVAKGPASWMDEIARSPHVERTARAGAAFLAWGGGGGVADDEGDARATNAAHPFLAEGTAPKPSRCYHWLIRVAGGDACAWRVRGLDDRPRAEFSRLEPGNGEPLVGMREDDDFRPPQLPLKDVAVAAMKAVAPIPLTTASTYKIGLVKSYAISNGERRLRSPEPPEPPNVVAIFMLAVRNGLPFLARYDICPTSTMPAVCRARVGIGHTSPVVDLITSTQNSCLLLGSGGWLASRGRDGDILIWRTNVSTGDWESMIAVALLPGPQSAVTFAPSRTSSHNRWEIGVFSCDSALGSLRLFQFVNFLSNNNNTAAQDIQFARLVSICHSRNRMSFDAVTQLIAVPLGKNHDPVTGCLVAVFGVRTSGRLCVWRVSRYMKDNLTMEPSMIRVVGGKHEVVTHAASTDLTNIGRQIFVTGGQDGTVYVYTIGDSEAEANVEHRYIMAESDEDDGDEGVIWLGEVCHLQNPSNDGPVEKIELLPGGSRILALYASGKARIWSRSSFETLSWDLEFETEGDREFAASGDDCVSVESTASLGYDLAGNYAAVVLRKDGSFDRYKRALGIPWEHSHRKEKPQDHLPLQLHTLVHIGKGIIVSGSGRGMTVLATNPSDAHPLSFSSDAAGYYNPSKSFFALLLTGGRAWQVTAALDELHVFVRNITKRKASEASYGSGRGLIAPPPSLSMLTSEREDNPVEDRSQQQKSIFNTFSSSPFLQGRSIFAELMAKSDVNDSNGRSQKEDELDEDVTDSFPDLSKLASRLRAISLAGLSRVDHSVLAAVARACASLRSTLKSLDVPGARFALIAACHQELSKKDNVPLSIVASAVHSSSSDALMDHFLPRSRPGQNTAKGQRKLWETARSLGAGWWIDSNSGARNLAERIARADFSSSRKADDAALWYVVLGRVTALSALYRAEQNIRMSQFLQRNFSKSENKTAAGKNAYVLVSKHRLQLAVAFFVLAGNIPGALSLVRTRIKDDQLAIFLSRILASGKHLHDTLNQIVKAAGTAGDDHRKCLALSLNGNHEQALREACKAQYPAPGARISEAERALTGSLPSVVHSLSHVLALAERPQIRVAGFAKEVLQDCRRKAVRALLGDGSPVAALVVGFQIMRNESHQKTENNTKAMSRKNVDTTKGAVLSAAVDALRGRAVCMAGAVRSGATEKSLQQLLMKDITDLRKSPMGLDMCIRAVERATFEMAKEDEVDGALIMTYAALEVLAGDVDCDRQLKRKIIAAQRNCLRGAVSRALFHVQGSLSLLHHPTFTSSRLNDLIGKYQAAMNKIEKDGGRSEIFQRLVLEFRGAVLSLRFAYAFLKGDWPGIWLALRACEGSWQTKVSSSTEEISLERDTDDSYSMTSGCSSLAPDSVSVEALRHVASNPVILSISKNLGHIRRFRKRPSILMVGDAGGAATVSDDAIGTPTLSVRADDPLAVIRIHPALSSTLSAASASYLAAHLAAQAADFAKTVAMEGKRKHRNSQLFWQSDTGEGYDQSFRLMKASETLEQLAEDAMSQWVPLQRFGAEASKNQMSQPDESAGAFVDLWSTLGCLPEYAPSLSEAATVAAAEMAAAASKAAIEAAEEKDGGRRRRRRRERRGETVASVAKEGLKHFDTTSADSLYGAYPVRFSASAPGPWSGRGKHATLYSEERALFRTLCLSSADPPSVIVATPKGIQEIVPSSYTTMPAGFRSHYSAKKNGEREEKDARLQALQDDRDEENMHDGHEDDSFITSYDGFGEGPYVALDMAAHDARQRNRLRSSRERKAVWRHQVQATTLASHPLRRRFASGAGDGVVRLWDFEDPISLASFRDDKFGRVSDLSFSAYGNTLLAVYSSGHITIWDDPDAYSSYPRGKGRKSSSNIISAFDNRMASGGTFLDERHTIAVVGDPTAPPRVGHSLRIFDTREPYSSFQASWSCAVNHQSEARCLALLEDRMRVVTGGLDGSLSIVDIRTNACIAELPAHEDEVTCLALETPRGRALVSGCSNGEIKLWDSRTLLQLDVVQEAHVPTRHYWSGNGISGLVGSYGTQGLALTDRSLISCGGDGVVKIWGPGWADFDLNVL